MLIDFLHARRQAKPSAPPRGLIRDHHHHDPRLRLQGREGAMRRLRT